MGEFIEPPPPPPLPARETVGRREGTAEAPLGPVGADDDEAADPDGGTLRECRREGRDRDGKVRETRGGIACGR